MDLFRNAWELVEIGGPVMIPIGALSAWMWILIVLRADWLWRVKRQSLSTPDALDRLRKGDVLDTPALCPKSGALRFFAAHHFDGRDRLCGEPDQILFEVAVRRQLKALHRGLPTIMILAAAAPLLGLLGTVTGMMETFRVIGLHGMGNAQAMASGVKEALITTQAGLLAAIPGVLAGQAMRGSARIIHNDMLVFHRTVSQWLEKEWRQCDESAP